MSKHDTRSTMTKKVLNEASLSSILWTNQFSHVLIQTRWLRDSLFCISHRTNITPFDYIASKYGDSIEKRRRIVSSSHLIATKKRQGVQLQTLIKQAGKISRQHLLGRKTQTAIDYREVTSLDYWSNDMSLFRCKKTSLECNPFVTDFSRKEVNPWYLWLQFISLCVHNRNSCSTSDIMIVYSNSTWVYSYCFLHWRPPLTSSCSLSFILAWILKFNLESKASKWLEQILITSLIDCVSICVTALQITVNPS